MIADVIGLGARGPLGLSTLQLTLGVRAHKKEPRSLRQRDRFGQEIGICFVGGLHPSLHGRRRLEALAAPALTEAVMDARARTEVADDYAIPIVLALPSPGRPDDEDELGDKLIAGIREHSGLAIDVGRSMVVRRDQPGFAHALLLGAEILAGGAPLVAVGGVDSYFHPEVLTWLDSTYRLASLKAVKGFIPGEGAAFIVLGRSKNKLASLTRVDIAEEKSDLDEDEPNIGLALTALLAQASERLGDHGWVINDCNGERHRRTEFDLAGLRTLVYDTHVDSWVDDLGDVGAASGALFSAIAIKLWQLECGHAKNAVITLASELGDRGLVAWRNEAFSEGHPS